MGSYGKCVGLVVVGMCLTRALTGCPGASWVAAGHYEGTLLMDTAYGEEGTTCGVAITLVQHRTTLLGTVQFGPRCFLPNELIDILGLDAFVLPVRGTWGSFGRLNLVFDPDRAAGEGLDFGCDLTLEGVGYDADEDDLVDYLTGEFTAEFFFEGVPDLGDVRIRPGGTFEAERAAD